MIRRVRLPVENSTSCDPPTGVGHDRPSPDQYPPSLDLIRKAALAKRLGVDPTTLMRWVREGQFPKPIRLSDSVIAWRVGTIEKHLAKLEAD